MWFCSKIVMQMMTALSTGTVRSTEVFYKSVILVLQKFPNSPHTFCYLTAYVRTALQFLIAVIHFWLLIHHLEILFQAVAYSDL